MHLERMAGDTEGLHTVATLYAAVFSGPDGRPDSVVEILGRLRRHMGYPGFRGLVLREGADTIGLAYGYTSLPGQFYRTKLERALRPDQAETWLSDCFELVALGVRAGDRRHGYGRALHDVLLDGVPAKTSVLTTEASNTAARSLYARRGWEILCPDFDPMGHGELFVIMGRRLPLSREKRATAGHGP
jgi:hypothetical protein